jgi:hypothetical protein
MMCWRLISQLGLLWRSLPSRAPPGTSRPTLHPSLQHTQACSERRAHAASFVLASGQSNGARRTQAYALRTDAGQRAPRGAVAEQRSALARAPAHLRGRGSRHGHLGQAQARARGEPGVPARPCVLWWRPARRQSDRGGHMHAASAVQSKSVKGGVSAWMCLGERKCHGCASAHLAATRSSAVSAMLARRASAPSSSASRGASAGAGPRAGAAPP